MNKQTRIYLLILIVLVAVFFISKIDSNKEKRFNFFAADSNSVAKIEITSATDTLHLAKENGEWKMTFPVVWSLQDGKMDKIMETVLTAESSSIPVSENEASLDKYSLTDSLATHLVTYDSKGNILDDLLVGKSSNYSVTPVRKTESNKVYLLEANISYMIKPAAKSWRRKEIIEIDPEQITRFMIISDEANYTLTQSDSLWQYADEKDSFDVNDDNATLKTMKSNFKRFAATDFIDNDFDSYSDALANPYFELNLEMWNGESYHLRFVPQEEKKYAVQLNNDTEVLYVVYESVVDKFIKQKEDFQ